MKLSDYLKQETKKLDSFEGMLDAESKEQKSLKAFVRADRNQNLQKYHK